MRIDIQNILCSTDLSEFSNHTIAYGAALAREFGARLYICHAINLPSVAAIYGNVYIDPVEEQRRSQEFVLQHFDEMMQDFDVPWEPLLPLGPAAEEIVKLTTEKEIDLVISATHGRSGIKRLVLGSVTQRLMRTLPCPLLVIRGPARELMLPAESVFRFHRILVGCDFSDDSRLAFNYGLSLAQEFQAELHLVHVIEPPVYMDLIQEHANLDDGPLLLENRLTEKLLEQLPPESLHWCTPKTSILEGLPDQELTRYAESHQIDLIVLGVRGYSLVEKLFVGSTTDRVIRRAPCPVLSVSPLPDQLAF